ncbi:MAG TPA: hypothetical protein PKD83_06645 [Ignavibacteria bacterium]|nr:hypothetical protein [Ignavibacteria bacterium]
MIPLNAVTIYRKGVRKSLQAVSSKRGIRIDSPECCNNSQERGP